jgi:predicted alpha/beta hydrolase family esterase
MRYGDDNDDDDDDGHDNDIVVVQPHLVVASRNDSTMTITRRQFATSLWDGDDDDVGGWEKPPR